MRFISISFACLAVIVSAAGCGTTKKRLATEQLLMSDAVDQAVANIDFRPLANRTVYLDTTYVKNVKGIGFVNSDYIISSLRQQMIAANCWLQDSKEEAEFIVEARVGTVGNDGNDIVYGLPQNSGLSSAASLVPNAPPLPAIPELSLAKKQSEEGAAKIALFAYHRESKRPVWQSGISRSLSTAQDVWIFGAGPFQRGTIHDGTQFAGRKIRIPTLSGERAGQRRNEIPYSQAYTFNHSDPASIKRADEIIKSLEPGDPERFPVQTVDWLTPRPLNVISGLQSHVDVDLESIPTAEKDSDTPDDDPAE